MLYLSITIDDIIKFRMISMNLLIEIMYISI